MPRNLKQAVAGAAAGAVVGALKDGAKQAADRFGAAGAARDVKKRADKDAVEKKGAFEGLTPVWQEAIAKILYYNLLELHRLSMKRGIQISIQNQPLYSLLDNIYLDINNGKYSEAFKRLIATNIELSSKDKFIKEKQALNLGYTPEKKHRYTPYMTSSFDNCQEFCSDINNFLTSFNQRSDSSFLTKDVMNVEEAMTTILINLSNEFSTSGKQLAIKQEPATLVSKAALRVAQAFVDNPQVQKQHKETMSVLINETKKLINGDNFINELSRVHHDLNDLSSKSSMRNDQNFNLFKRYISVILNAYQFNEIKNNIDHEQYSFELTPINLENVAITSVRSVGSRVGKVYDEAGKTRAVMSVIAGGPTDAAYRLTFKAYGVLTTSKPSPVYGTAADAGMPDGAAAGAGMPDPVDDAAAGASDVVSPDNSSDGVNAAADEEGSGARTNSADNAIPATEEAVDEEDKGAAGAIDAGAAIPAAGAVDAGAAKIAEGLQKLDRKMLDRIIDTIKIKLETEYNTTCEKISWQYVKELLTVLIEDIYTICLEKKEADNLAASIADLLRMYSNQKDNQPLTFKTHHKSEEQAAGKGFFQQGKKNEKKLFYSGDKTPPEKGSQEDRRLHWQTQHFYLSTIERILRDDLKKAVIETSATFNVVDLTKKTAIEDFIRFCLISEKAEIQVFNDDKTKNKITDLLKNKTSRTDMIKALLKNRKTILSPPVKRGWFAGPKR